MKYFIYIKIFYKLFQISQILIYIFKYICLKVNLKYNLYLCIYYILFNVPYFIYFLIIILMCLCLNTYFTSFLLWAPSNGLLKDSFMCLYCFISCLFIIHYKCQLYFTSFILFLYHLIFT